MLSRLLLSLLLVAGTLVGQDAPNGSSEKGGKSRVARNLEALRSISSAIAEVEAELNTQREKLEATGIEEVRKGIQEEISNLVGRRETLQVEFERSAAGVERAEFDSVEQPDFNIQNEVQDALRPVFRSFNDATSGLRELDELRTRLENARQREDLAEAAVERLSTLVEATEEGALRDRLAEMQTSWQGRALQERSQAEALRVQIEELEKSDVSMLRRVSDMTANFTKTRGKNLLLAFLAMVVVYLVLRWLYGRVRRFSPFHKGKGIFMGRVVDIVVAMVSILLSLGAAFVVFYVAGDWVLLVVGIVFLLGVFWASKHTLPLVFEQTKLLLNLGPVREGERLVFEGVPWRVDRLGPYCEFSNPAFPGAELRLPLRSLVDLHSRPLMEKEPWFPTEIGEWVKMPDGLIGKVVVQSPEQVELVKLGGSRVFFPAPDFLGMAPENLSHNFRISVTFGIDYAHQAICTTEVPLHFKVALEKELLAKVGKEGLINVNVEFASAGASSLDYEILADFDGEKAARYNPLTRLISRVCVDVCNEHGYVIPFTQITVHQASS